MSAAEYLGINIDYSRDELFDELGRKRLQESYMLPEETSPQERFASVSKLFGSNPEHSQRLYDYSSKHWLSYSTPLLSFGRTKRGLPISCYLSYIDDSAEGLVNTLSEVNWLSMLGGGVGIGVGMRSSDEKSSGVMSHMKTYDASSLAYRQGTTRRGSFAAYLDISHPDIINFIEMRKPTGDPNIRCLNLHHGVNISDKFMEIIEKCQIDPSFDDTWELIDPNSARVISTISAKYLWQQLLELRMTTGEPYFLFIDTANAALPREQYDAGLRIRQSNICCLDKDSQIHISKSRDGSDSFIEKIGSFVEKYNLGYFGGDELYIKSYDVISKTIQWNVIEGAKYSGDVYTLYGINGVQCTPEHLLWTENRGYTEARNIAPNDILLSDKKTLITNLSIQVREYSPGAIPVYDIAVKNTHNFFANDVLVHNSEITLATDKERTAVCCLSSLNLFYWDEFKDDLNQFVSDVAEMLDNALTYFIEHAPDAIERARFSAYRERSIGIGTLGFHSFLQKKMIPFESVAAKVFNNSTFRAIRQAADVTNLRLGKERGEAPDMLGTGKRFTHLMAIAPNACLQKEARIQMADHTIQSLEELINQYGEVSVKELENITITLEDGTTKNLSYTDFVLVKRNGKTKSIIAYNLKEGDELLEVD